MVSLRNKLILFKILYLIGVLGCTKRKEMCHPEAFEIHALLSLKIKPLGTVSINKNKKKKMNKTSWD